jgi:hypothetical protein
MTSLNSSLSCAKAKLLAIAIGFCLAGAVHSPRVEASGIPVVDGGHILAQVTEFAEQLKRYEAEVNEWKSKLSQNPLDRIKEDSDSRPKIGNQLQIKDDDEGVEQRCDRDGSGSPMAAIANVFSFSFNPNGNLRDEQKKLCTLQVTLENRKWNENVLMIRQMELLQEQLDTVADARSSGMTEGEINTQFGDMQAAQADFDVNMSKGQARIETLDNTLASVAHMQSMAAQQILAGSKPSGFAAEVAGQLVQGALLETALSVGNSECGGRLGERCSP